MSNDIYQNSLELHRRHNGKLSIISKVKLDSKEDLALAYTPGVAEVCRQIATDPRLAYDYTLKANTVAIVSDGSAILGLGNLGPLAAIPVMEGKAAILKEFAGVDAFPICLDTQDPEAIITAVKQLAPVFGAINLEDIAAPACFMIEERLRAELDIPVMHDDQWGAATVILAGLINALKLRQLLADEAVIVINGLGAAGIATARLLLAAGFRHLIFCDSQGIVHQARPGLSREKQELLTASSLAPKAGSLAEALVGAHVFIGLSKAGALSAELVKTMSERPIIFALANPTPEIMPDEARAAGAFIIATGRSDFPNQLNNSLVFPGVFRGALSVRLPQFRIEIFSALASALADYVEEPTPDRILPTMFDPGVVELVAETVKKFK